MNETDANNEHDPRALRLSELETFALRLLDIDDLGLFCSDDVKDEVRRLFGLPPHPDSIRLKQEISDASGNRR